MNVHIIDDDPSTLLVYSKIAANCGLSYASFSSSEDYLLKMTHPGYQPPHVILTDVEMLDINGYELITEVRHIFPNQRFIVTTSTPEKKGCCDSACLYYQKPVSNEDLRGAFLCISKCVECGGHPAYSEEKACFPDDRSKFSIEGWLCPFQSH